jgi:hypothetical protein
MIYVSKESKLYDAVILKGLISSNKCVSLNLATKVYDEGPNMLAYITAKN